MTHSSVDLHVDVHIYARVHLRKIARFYPPSLTVDVCTCTRSFEKALISAELSVYVLDC